MSRIAELFFHTHAHNLSWVYIATTHAPREVAAVFRLKIPCSLPKRCTFSMYLAFKLLTVPSTEIDNTYTAKYLSQKICIGDWFTPCAHGLATHVGEEQNFMYQRFVLIYLTGIAQCTCNKILDVGRLNMASCPHGTSVHFFGESDSIPSHFCPI